MPDPRHVLRAAIGALVLLSPGIAQASQVELISKRHPSFTSDEVLGTADRAALSADGRWIAFTSSSPNLMQGQSDGNGNQDVFLLERLTGALTLVSHAAGFPTSAGNADGANPSISADGRYVAFQSGSTNLVPGQVSSYTALNVFLYDRIDGTTALVSHATGSATAGANGHSWQPVISKDGSYVAFPSTGTNLVPGATDANGKIDVFLYERVTGALTLVSHSSAAAGTAANGLSWLPKISAEGRFVLYSSDATNVVAGQTDTNGNGDVFLYDRVSGANALVSHAAGLPSTTGNAFALESLGLSDDGAYCVFLSGATNLVAGQVDPVSASRDAFLYERATGTVTLLSHANGAPAMAARSGSVSISGDGAWITFQSPGTNLIPGQTDTNDAEDVFLLQRATGAVTLVSRQSGSATSTGNAGTHVTCISEDGRYVALTGEATDLVAGQTDAAYSNDVFLFDRAAGTTMLMSHADGSSVTAGQGNSFILDSMLAADGSFAVYSSSATNLTADADENGGLDLFLFSRSAGSSAAISFSEPVVHATPDWFSYGLPSRDGRFAVLTSLASDLVGQTDTEGNYDVFLVDRIGGATTLISHAAGSPETGADSTSSNPSISADGKWVVFDSQASDLIPDIGPPPPNSLLYNVFLYGHEAGTLTLVSRSAADPTRRANGWSFRQVISGDGRWVAFTSNGNDLVSGQIDPGAPFGSDDVFLYDRVTGGMALASHSPSNPLEAVNGSGLNERVGISLDGRCVAFASLAGNLVAGETDGNGGSDLYLYDRDTGAVTLVSRAAGSATATANYPTLLRWPPALSADGRFFAFTSSATNLVAGQADANNVEDIFLFDRVAGTTILVSRKSGTLATAGNGYCLYPRISDDGRYVAFSCTATDLVPGQIDLNQSYDAFLFDRTTGTVSLLTPDGISTDPNGYTFASDLGPDGRFVALVSQDTLRVPGQSDQNGRVADVFLLDRLAGTTRLASRSRISPLTTGNLYSSDAWLAGGGSIVLFNSAASDLADGDFNQESDIFVSSAGSTPAADFFTLPPCRAADTRATGSLSSGVAALFDLHGVCGIPATARAVALNVTVMQGSGQGHLVLYPGDADLPLANAISFHAGQTRADNAILPLAYDGSGTLAVLPALAGGGTVHVIVDVSGYFQ